MWDLTAGLLGGDWRRAEDILQETAICAWQYAAELDTAAEALRPWIRVVKRSSMDPCRSWRARRNSLSGSMQRASGWIANSGMSSPPDSPAVRYRSEPTGLAGRVERWEKL
ncbi:hypothetical protein OHA17_38740 [Streptomyces sp. NBC_00212]